MGAGPLEGGSGRLLTSPEGHREEAGHTRVQAGVCAWRQKGDSVSVQWLFFSWENKARGPWLKVRSPLYSCPSGQHPAPP